MQRIQIQNFSLLSVLLFLTMFTFGQELQPNFGFGKSLSEILKEMTPLSDSIFVKLDEEIQLPTAKKTQSQLDVYGYVYAGKKRKVEFLFADDRLDMVWILTEADEQTSFLKEFKQLLGEPSHEREEATYFIDKGIAVRNQPHEILFISERLIQPYKQFLESQSAGR